MAHRCACTSILVSFTIRKSRGVYPTEAIVHFPPQDGRMGPPIFDYNAPNAVLTDDMTFLSFDNHFETKVRFFMYFGSQIITEYLK